MAIFVDKFYHIINTHIDMDTFKKGNLLQKVQEHPDKNDKQSIVVVTLRNFQFNPRAIEVNTGSQIVVQVDQNRRNFSDVYQERAFIFAIQQFQMQSPPLKFKDLWTFKLEKQGKYEVSCINYCKLSFAISVIQNVSQRSLVHVDQETNNINNPAHLNQQQKDRFEAFTFEEFENLISSKSIAKFDEIPDYLLRCFKTELNILEAMELKEKIPKRTRVSSAACRQNSTNTQQCSAYEEFEQSRRTSSPGKSKALTIFQDQERGDLQSRALKKTSSQVINLQWKQEIGENIKKQPCQTFQQQIQKFLKNKQIKVEMPLKNQTVNNLLLLLKNRINILKLI